MDMVNIQKEAERFREVIETAKANGECGDFFRRFPNGQCGNSSDLLAQHFIDIGVTNVFYVWGTYYGNDPGERQSHAWLDIDGIIIDITADQFRYHDKPLYNDKKVYVGPENSWYGLFEINGKHPHNGIEPTWTNSHDLKAWYGIICSYLP